MTKSNLENLNSLTDIRRILRKSLFVLAFEAVILLWFVLSCLGRVDLLNILVPAGVVLISGMLLYRNQVRVSVRAVQLEEYSRELNDASRRDALTGLLNRMALEADACTMDGRNMTAYMIDIDYFKEINDRYGHATGDALLRETSGALKHLFPGAHYYRYGGDEFLVLTHKPAAENYGAETYDLRNNSCGVRLFLSIGNAQGAPVTYDDLFVLISRADKALYTVKERTHSVEHGGHDRRKKEHPRGGAEVCA